MGVRARFTEIAAAAVDRVAQGNWPDPPEQYKCHSIDKEWITFYQVFKDKGTPLSRAVVGDVLHPRSSHTFEQFCESGHEWYVAFISAPLVQAIAKSLGALLLGDLKRWFEELEIEFTEYDSIMFDTMKTAYCSAATRGNALMILIA